MQVIDNPNKISDICHSFKKAAKTIGFVPTMGHLHQGHLSLIANSKKTTDVTIASVFVNPTQFNDPKDLELYPRDLEGDTDSLSQAGVDILFAPTIGQIYPQDFETFVEVSGLSTIHEGEFRPGHFKGVATIVNILFNLVQADKAFFGDKDFQQLIIIKRMVSDLKMPISIIGCPIVREADGLALSSRNVRISQTDRAIASKIFKALQAANIAFKSGKNDSQELVSYASAELEDPSFKIEYIRIVDSKNLKNKISASKGDRMIAAVWLSGVRLIDNIELG